MEGGGGGSEAEKLNQINRNLFSVYNHLVSSPPNILCVYVVIYLINELNNSSCSFAMYKKVHKFNSKDINGSQKTKVP